ncbi:MAG: aspartate-semialdehyde dehydrogenase [Deltaproteobacteria bacterium]|nr:aspartate-semialdehyde dehydrogenase [Deltaproteobacteria bacterium]
MGHKIPVAVVGATGLAGQQFLAALARHPVFEVAKLAASSRSAGKSYQDAIREASGQVKWYASGSLDSRMASLVVEEASALDVSGMGAVFSALESEPARELEPRYAAHAPVISTASAYRYEADVPILIPGVNLDHAKLIEVQRQNRGWKGFITPNPNCTTTGLAITLAPLHERFGVKRVFMTSMQACSGAGRSPGVIGLDIIDNVIPYIAKEEEKVEKETRKILGTLDGAGIKPASFVVSCTCTRVPVLEGHTEAVFVELGQPATEEEIKGAWREFGAAVAARRYPSSPEHLIHVHEDPFRPQPRLDRDNEDGMATTVGRLRRDEALTNGWKYLLVSHNTKMGAAKGALLVAEYLAEKGYIG